MEHDANSLDWPSELREPERRKQFRARLITHFSRIGCSKVEELADDTFDRAQRLLHRWDRKMIPFGKFLFAIANNVAHENFREQKKIEQLDDSTADEKVARSQDALQQILTLEEEQRRRKCATRCLQALSEWERYLFISYQVLYDDGNQDCVMNRAEIRKGLASYLGISGKALGIRISRIRTKLISCAKDCFREN